MNPVEEARDFIALWGNERDAAARRAWEELSEKYTPRGANLLLQAVCQLDADHKADGFMNHLHLIFFIEKIMED